MFKVLTLSIFVFPGFPFMFFVAFSGFILFRFVEIRTAHREQRKFDLQKFSHLVLPVKWNL